MNAFEFGQLVGASLEKQANKYKSLMNLAAPAANAAANTAASTARRAAPAATSGPGTLPAQWVRNHQTIARGINPATGLKPGAVAPAPPAPVAPAPVRDFGRVPTGQPATTELQSFYNNATGGGRQRMIGIDPQGRGVPAAPQSWEQLSPAQQAAVGQFYSGGK